jgi:ABC-type uncharacterized transport system substrate-binding protein
MSATAHPHAWIDLQSQVLLDDEGRVRALRFDWVFDDYYTVAIAESGQPLDQLSDSVWTEIAGRNLSNLTDYDYFTAVKFNNEPVELGTVTRYEGGLRDGRMWMRFEVPLAKPIDPKAGSLSFAVYDPTYYIEIVHIEEDIIAFDGPGADRCQGEIVQPNPTFEQVTLAAALDKNESAGDGLGELFAETVLIHC